MRQLLLMRHAKSSWSQETLKDFDRPLNEQGREAAVKVGNHMKVEGLIPDQIYCSPAARTRETLERLKTASGLASPILYMDGLYGATRERLFHIMGKISENARSLMLVGHNPGMHDLAIALADGAVNDNSTALFQKFPTGALAIFQLDIPRWSELTRGEAQLLYFIRPKML